MEVLDDETPPELVYESDSDDDDDENVKQPQSPSIDDFLKTIQVKVTSKNPNVQVSSCSFDKDYHWDSFLKENQVFNVLIIRMILMRKYAVHAMEKNIGLMINKRFRLYSS